MEGYEYYITPEEYEQAKKMGVGNRTLERRIRDFGWSKKKAITTPLVVNDPEKIKWRNKAVENGISKQLFNNRVNAHGWTYERAATTPKFSVGNTYRKYSDEVLKKAKETIGQKVFYDRMRKGWTIERALNEPLYTSEQKINKMNERRDDSTFRNFNYSFWSCNKQFKKG